MAFTDSFEVRISPRITLSLWAITRLWVILCGFKVFPYPQSEFLFSDVHLYDWWAGNILDGHFPINDPMWQYPPLAAVIFALGYAIAPNTVGFVLLALIADAILMSTLTRHMQREVSSSAGLIWALAPIAVGPIFLGRFDVFPTLFACLALLYIKQPAKTGLWLSVGTFLKVWPGLALLIVPRKLLSKAILSSIVSSIGLLVLIHLWWADNLNFLQGQRSRGLQIESVGALPYMVWNATSSSVTTNFQFGAIEVIARGTVLVSAFITIIFLIFLAWIAINRLRGNLETAEPSHMMLLIVLMSMLTSRVLSPQYNIWILGLSAVTALSPMANFKKISALIFLSALCGQLLYPWLYVSFQQGGVVPTTVQAIRIIALVSATVLTWKSVTDQVRDHQAKLPAA